MLKKQFVNPLSQVHECFNLIPDRFTLAIVISGEKTE